MRNIENIRKFVKFGFFGISMTTTSFCQAAEYDKQTPTICIKSIVDSKHQSNVPSFAAEIKKTEELVKKYNENQSLIDSQLASYQLTLQGLSSLFSLLGSELDNNESGESENLKAKVELDKLQAQLNRYSDETQRLRDQQKIQHQQNMNTLRQNWCKTTKK